MSKAEDRALKEYPQNIVTDYNGSHDLNYYKRVLYQQGYHQAEKDLELTWKDIQKIDVLIYAVLDEEKYKRYYTQDRDGDFYEEVLKRFNKERKEK